MLPRGPDEYTHKSLTGGTVCDGIQMQKTAMLMQVMTKAVPHFSLNIVLLCSAMMAIRLTMICMSSWISKTQRNRMKKRTGTLLRDQPHSLPVENTHQLTLAI